MNHVQQLVENEPWRSGQGQPATILDPAWQGARPLCSGEIEWEGQSKWWWCKTCGYCGSAHSTTHHMVVHPLNDIATSIAFFMDKKCEQGVHPELARDQLMFIAAAAIRYAATLPMDGLGQYVRSQLTIR
jgi:hypothetical protein